MKASKLKPDTLFIFTFALLLLFLPLLIKTKTISAVIVPEALLIVIGGTITAGILSFSYEKTFRALKSLKTILYKKNENEFLNLCEEIIETARISRMSGIYGLGEISDNIQNAFLKQAIKSIYEDCDPKAYEENLRFNAFLKNKDDFENIEIFEELGGYAPVFGMLGAVLGLIQVCAMNFDPKMLLSGIASAFAATVYGIGLANLFFFPIANRLKGILNEKLIMQEAVISCVLDILNRKSPIIVGEKLNNFMKEKKGKILKFAA